MRFGRFQWAGWDGEREEQGKGFVFVSPRFVGRGKTRWELSRWGIP